jgi:hypothetical protein
MFFEPLDGQSQPWVAIPRLGCWPPTLVLRTPGANKLFYPGPPTRSSTSTNAEAESGAIPRTI